MQSANSNHRYVRPDREERVPIRTIMTAIGLVLATVLALLLAYEARRVLVWIVVDVLYSRSTA
jgi:hypothetical protein